MSETAVKKPGIGNFLKEVYEQWNDVSPFRLAAIISYYAILSLPGLLVILVKIAGAVYGEKAIRGNISGEVSSMIGQEAATQMQTLLINASQNDSTGVFATIIGAVTLLFGATGVFFHMKISLNITWGLPSGENMGIKKVIKDRLLSLAMVLLAGALLAISIAASSAVGVVGYLASFLPISGSEAVAIRIAGIVLSLITDTVLFAMLYRVLPDARIKWQDTLTGAFLTAILFEIGKVLIGFYIATSNPASAYGAAGSVILILIWVSYTSIIIFFGAAFTKVYTERYGSGIKPRKI